MISSFLFKPILLMTLERNYLLIFSTPNRCLNTSLNFNVKSKFMLNLPAAILIVSTFYYLLSWALETTYH